MEDPLFRGTTPGGAGLTEDVLRQRLAYCKARLTDIDNAPHHSRHRQDRARVVNQIREFEAALGRLRDSRSGSDRLGMPSRKRANGYRH